MSALAYVVVTLAVLVQAASAINCYTAFVKRNFTDVEFPAGTFGPFPDNGNYQSCITYTVEGNVTAQMITYPVFSEKLRMHISGIDGQGVTAPCSALIVGGVPTQAFMQYVYTPWTSNANKVFTCCEGGGLCNGDVAVVLVVLASPALACSSSILVMLSAFVSFMLMSRMV